MKDDTSTRTNEGTGDGASAEDRAPPARERWLAGQNEAFKSAVNGAPLPVSLDILIQTAIDEVQADRCAFYIANEAGTELTHVVGMPEDYAKEVDGFKIGKESLACGLAVATAAPVITPDVREEPRWQPWLWLAERYGHRSCWSFPVGTRIDEPVGTFTMYFAEPREPTKEDLAFATSLTATASIIIAEHRSMAALRDSEARYRNLFESIDEAYAIVEVLKNAEGEWADFRFLEVNPAFMKHTSMPYPVGRTATELLASPNPRWAQIYGTVLDSGEPVRIEETEQTLGKTFDLNIVGLDRDRSRVAVLFTDITERRHNERALRESEKHAKTLLAELQHRVRNTLAVVRSIARRTADRSSDLDQMVSHFEGRLNAFSRVQSAVTRSPGTGVNIKEIISDEMLAIAVREGSQLKIKGPDLELQARPAESISLAVHELATNAVKYGAVAAPHGRIRVNWQTVPHNGTTELHFEWIESGLDRKPVSTREGFGHELLLKTLPYELEADTNITFTEDGLRFTMRMPLGPAVLA